MADPSYPPCAWAVLFTLWKLELLPCRTDELTLVFGAVAIEALSDVEIYGPLYFECSDGVLPRAPVVVAWKLLKLTIFELSSCESLVIDAVNCFELAACSAADPLLVCLIVIVRFLTDSGTLGA